MFFWKGILEKKILDRYATSNDHDPRTEALMVFFKPVQNEIYWATHAQTVAEKIYYSAGGGKPYIGRLSFNGEHPI